MRTSSAGIALIKEFESCKLKAYKDPVGILTIGVGHTTAAGPPKVYPGMIISPPEADTILRMDLARFERDIDRLVKPSLSQNQFDAIVSWTFNCGVGALEKSTLLKRINAKQFDKVPAELMKWTRANGKELPGLVRRRRAEAKMWRGVDDSGEVSVDEARATPDKPKPTKSMLLSREGNAAVVTSGVTAAAAAAEVAKQANDTASTFAELLHNPVFLALLVAAILGVAIWYFRKQRNEEEGG